MQIEINVPDGKSGEWEVSTFEITKKDASFQNMRAAFSFSDKGRFVVPGIFKKLTHNRTVVISNTAVEISDHTLFIYKAQREGGHILINGLGLGVALKAVLESNKVKTITIIEKSQDVITLVAPTYLSDPRVTIIHADAFEWKPPKNVRYNLVWHDIWNHICIDNLPEMTKLHRKYGKKTDWQDSWCKGECLYQREQQKTSRSNYRW